MDLLRLAEIDRMSMRGCLNNVVEDVQKPRVGVLVPEPRGLPKVGVGRLPDVGQPTRYEVFRQPELYLIASPRKICDSAEYKGNYKILGVKSFQNT